MTIFLWVILSILSIYFIPIIFGDDFTKSISPTILLMSSVIFVAIGAAMESFWLSQNKPGYVSLVNTFGAGVTVICAPIFIVYLDIVGMALALWVARLLSSYLLSKSFCKATNTSILRLIFPTKDDLNFIFNQIKGIINR